MSAGRVTTTPCTFRPLPDGDSTMTGPPAAGRYRTPVAVPPGATAFTSLDGFGGRTYFLGPAQGKCVAHAGMDQDFDQQIRLDGGSVPAYEQVFGRGGDSQIRFSCRYLPTIRAYAEKYFHLNCPAVPPREHVRLLRTGMPGLHAALVRVPPGVTDPQLATSGSGPVLALVMGFDYGADGPDYRKVTSSYADCRLGAVCRASLQVFTEEAIAWQTRYNGLRPVGDPGFRIRQAVRRH